MTNSCLSTIRQGWLGVPIFLIGLVTLAYSQFSEDETSQNLSPEEMAESVGTTIKQLENRLGELGRNLAGNSFDAKSQAILRNLGQVPANDEKRRITNNLQAVADAWNLRRQEVNKGITTVEGRLNEAGKIYSDLEENFAGRMEEAMPALEVVKENLNRSSLELDALNQLLENASEDAKSGYNTLIRESEAQASAAPQFAPVQPVAAEPVPVTETGRNLAAVIKANEAVSLDGQTSFGSSIQSEAGEVLAQNQSKPNSSDEMIRKLRSELENSKSMQSELSTDTANLQSDLRKAYREIVSLQSNLRESEMMVSELQNAKNSLWKTSDGQLPNADTVSKQISQLQKDLEITRADLRQSRQSLLLEQDRSNSMIRSITAELERTRRELDDARVAAVSSGADSGRLMLLERELSQTKRALQMARNAPSDASSETYLNLQDELRKAMGEIARMQVEIGQKDDLEKQLLQLRSSLEEVGENPSRSASPAYVNKLLIDLNAAKKEVIKAQAANQQERMQLAEKVISLENELQATQLELEKTQLEFERTKESVATREFEFASTIKKLEEDAQLAQQALSKASLGQLPAIPFVNEMEESLANSEARMEVLTDRFQTEQARATEVIDGLKMELDEALIRQKQAIAELNIREKTLVGKDDEIAQLRNEKKVLQEELDVVKVIAGQLNDLNEVLEDTKETQSSQTGTMDSVVASLRDELNKAKVELVFALEEKDKIQQESSLKIINLEQILEDTRAQLMVEEENLVEQARDSKDLMIELKSELDAARDEIARMKTAGLGDSVETRQAVAQLQEALGTIRILQESLNESEALNLEVDNLRSELASAMSTQLNELQTSEDEKNKLQQKVNDLNAEIVILREQGAQSGVVQKNVIADLQEKLKSSNALVSDLETRLNDSEDLGVTALVEMEDQLNQERSRNQDLQNELKSMRDNKAKTVELLEKELANAMNQLDMIESGDSSSVIGKLQEEIDRLKLAQNNQNSNQGGDVQIQELQSKLQEALSQLDHLEKAGPDLSNDAMIQLEDELANAEKTIVELQGQLDERNSKSNELFDKLEIATQKLAELEAAGSKPTIVSSPNTADGFKELEDELIVYKLQAEELQIQNQEEKEERSRIESELAAAMQKLNSLEQSRAQPLTDDDKMLVNDLQDLLSQKDESIEELEGKLNEAIEEITNKEAELELAKAMQIEPKTPAANDETDSEVVLELQAEIDLLKSALEQLRIESASISIETNPEMENLKKKYQDAVAASMEMEMELEEFKLKNAEMENQLVPQFDDEAIKALVEEAKQSELEAQERIEELTAALRDSESLRKEVESILYETVEGNTQEKSIEQDPRVIDLQNEMVLLQQDLLNARDLKDPRVIELENALTASREDGIRLNEEFKNAMQDFARMKERLENLEAENRKLNDVSLAQARTQAGQQNADLRAELNRSLSDVTNLRNQLAEREQRLQNLNEQLAIAQTTRPGISPDNSALRAQLIRLQGRVQTALDGESQADLRAERVRGELAAANQKIASLEQSLLQSQSLQRGVPSRLPSTMGQTSPLTPVQIAELNSLREQNKRLQEQFQTLANAPGRQDLDRRIQDLNQKNLTAQIQLDQERSRVQDLRTQLEDARKIRQEVIERGQSANLKVNLLNDQLGEARGRIDNLERALYAAREAIRILQKGGSGNSTIQVSMPSSSANNLNQRSRSTNNTFGNNPTNFSRSVPSYQANNEFSRRPSVIPSRPRYSERGNTPITSSSLAEPILQNVPSGGSTLQLKAEVQFLNNKKRPAGFTEFFLVRDNLESILENARIRIPQNEGINSYAEFWARAVQRGYRFPGVAAAIRNALARASLTRLKTNSVGVANVDELESGRYHLIGASTLGQVGVVWSKPISLQGGENQISLDLRDAAWAQ